MGFKVRYFVVKYGSSHCSLIFQVRARSVKGNNIFLKQYCCLHVITENNVGTVSIDLSMNPSPEQQRECPQHHSHSRPQYLCLPSSTRKSTYRTSTDIESFINVWTLCKMMLYVSSFLSNFIDSILCLGFTHDVVYCSTLFFFITVEYALNDHMAMYWSILLTV